MSSPIFMALRLLKDPEISNRVILQFAFRQAKAVGYLKVLSAAFGALIVAASSVIKIPQVRKIVRPENPVRRAELAAGLLKDSVRLETLAQFIHVAYNHQQGNAFVNYGESFLLGVQNIALLLVLEYYSLRRKLGSYSVHPDNEQRQECLRQLLKPALTIAAVYVFITKIASRRLVLALQVVNIPITIFAKIPQIQRNADLRSTKHLSEITVGANMAGSLLRVFTTVVNYKKHRSRDAVLLLGYLTSFALNAVLAAQIVNYRKEKTD
ncbi:hypothetical protein HF325_000728 [Metschnikowia pulcherrima]|uniref:Solute carrier family 66 member 3 n=1 Tax=Metschnikowia pulcherrima TaxID=27326 RepID=A0A8H7GZV2_9ASCO|nr:hypothetical protein HF325_000728 [Metschnikowia pulcherrima]